MPATWTVFLFTSCLVFHAAPPPVVHRMDFKMQTWLDPPLKMTSHCTQSKSQVLPSSTVREFLLLEGSTDNLLSTQPAVYCHGVRLCSPEDKGQSHAYGLHQQVPPMTTMESAPNTGALPQASPQKQPTGLHHIILLYFLLSISHYKIIVLFFTFGILLLTEVGNLKF